MPLRSPSSTGQQDMGPRDSPPSEVPDSALLGGSGNGARADVARKTTEVEHMLANLEEEGVEIDGKIASILDDEIARIKAEAKREKKINGLKINGCVILYTISIIAIGFVLGADFVEQSLPAHVAKTIIFGDKIA
ncbi:hypothetical protein ACQ4PT_022052 [Festuca glaucescens]